MELMIQRQFLIDQGKSKKAEAAWFDKLEEELDRIETDKRMLQAKIEFDQKMIEEKKQAKELAILAEQKKKEENFVKKLQKKEHI